MTECNCDFCKKYGKVFSEYEQFKKDNPHLKLTRYKTNG